MRLAAPLLLLSLPAFSQSEPEPHQFFRQQARLTSAEITQIDRGEAVAKVLNTSDADEMRIFGAVYVQADPEKYVRFATNVANLRAVPQYLAIRLFSRPPTPSDLEGFDLSEEDIRALRTCKPADCDLQMPSEAMEVFRKRIDWSNPAAAQQVNDRARLMALELIRRYQQQGNSALGAYHDQDKPANVAEQFRALLSSSTGLPTYLPALHKYLLEYPNAQSPDIEPSFYWERVNFGLKPTLRLNHSVAYRTHAATGPTHVVAIKQLYSSHYFQVALDITACVKDSTQPSRPGFYLISVKGSRQEGLTGIKGSLLRKVVASKARSAQESAMNSLKRMLESP